MAAEHLRMCLAAVFAAPVESARPAPGLLQGWAGVALSLLRLRDQPWAGEELQPITEAIPVCFERDLAGCREEAGHLLGISENRALPYLGAGSAALGLVADWLLMTGLHPRAAHIRELVVRTLRRPLVITAGLCHGRAGLAVVLAQLEPQDPALALHRNRLCWHLVGPVEARETLGQQNLRNSLDLLSGSAGLLLAGAQDTAARILPLPTRTLALDHCEPVDMIVVNQP